MSKAAQNAFEIFLSLFHGKTVSPELLLQIQAKGTLNGNNLSKHCMALPERFVNAIMPELRNYFGGKSAGIVTSTDGGASLHEPQMQTTLKMYDSDDGRIFPRVTHVPCARGSMKWPQAVQSLPGDEGASDEFAEQAGVAAEWLEEGTEPSFGNFDPNLRPLNMDCAPLGAIAEFSRRLAEASAPNVEALLRMLFRATLLQKIDRRIINGTGERGPIGILQTAGINHVNRAGANDVSDDDLTNVEQSLSPMIRNRAIWVLADDVVTKLKKKKDLQERPRYPELSGEKPMLRGAPVVATRITKLGSAGDVLFFVPDQYVSPVEEELTVVMSDQAKLSKGIRLFMCYMSVGGKVANPTAFTKLV